MEKPLLVLHDAGCGRGVLAGGATSKKFKLKFKLNFKLKFPNVPT